MTEPTPLQRTFTWPVIRNSLTPCVAFVRAIPAEHWVTGGISWGVTTTNPIKQGVLIRHRTVRTRGLLVSR